MEFHGDFVYCKNKNSGVFNNAQMRSVSGVGLVLKTADARSTSIASGLRTKIAWKIARIFSASPAHERN
jgi:hypothetical protein